MSGTVTGRAPVRSFYNSPPPSLLGHLSEILGLGREQKNNLNCEIRRERPGKKYESERTKGGARSQHLFRIHCMPPTVLDALHIRSHFILCGRVCVWWGGTELWCEDSFSKYLASFLWKVNILDMT